MKKGLKSEPRLLVEGLRIIVGFVFVVSGIANMSTAATNPEEYRGFSETALVDIYSDLIESVSPTLMQILLGLVGFYEFILGALVISRGWPVKVGLVMGIIFALAISMLGVEELPALALIPVFGYLYTKDYHRTAFSRLRLGRKSSCPA